MTAAVPDPGLPAHGSAGSVPLDAAPAPARAVPTGEATPAAGSTAAEPAAGSTAERTAPPAEPAVEPVAAAEQDTAPAPARGRRLAALAAVLVVTLGLAALAGLLFVRDRAARTVEAYYTPASAPLNAARTAGKVLFSYDHRRLEQDFAAGAALSTGTFRKEYARTTQAVVRDVALQYKAVVQAEAVVAGVSEAEPGEVEAVVFVNQSTTSTKVQGEKVDQSRVRMTLVERDGKWLVSKVAAV